MEKANLSLPPAAPSRSKIECDQLALDYPRVKRK
jgi:hypothetical protein